MARPVALLTFANDRYGPTTGYLRDLIGEQRAITAAFDSASVDVVTQANITLDELYDLFNRYGHRLVVWHHGGHAESDALFLEDDDGRPQAARIEGLAKRIGQLRRLKLMTLNGCSTAGQVETLRAHCTSAIIATDRAIVDAAARAFAERFYRDLVADQPIDEAFDSAVGRVEAEWDGPTRMLRPGAPTSGGVPWRLHIDPERTQTRRWRLSHAHHWTARDPRVWGIAAAVLAAAVWMAWPAPEPITPIATGRFSTVIHAIEDAMPDVIERAIRDAYVTPPPRAPFEGREPDPAKPNRPAAVWVPGGLTPLGRPPEAVPHASPQRNVEMPHPLWVMVTPITRGQYREVIGALPPTPSFLGEAPRAAADNTPVTGITAAEAERFAAQISARDGLSPPHAWRLPTEEEWEYVCRVGGPEDDVGPVAAKVDEPPPVGGEPNAWQIRDLLGVVHQWTATPFPPDAANPSERVRLGGHYQTSRRQTLRCSYRDTARADVRDAFTGFRLVRTAEPRP